MFCQTHFTRQKNILLRPTEASQCLLSSAYAEINQSLRRLIALDSRCFNS